MTCAKSGRPVRLIRLTRMKKLPHISSSWNERDWGQMYDSLVDQGYAAVARQASLLRRLFRVRVGTTVVLLGMTSLFTDISSEMITTVLPLYLTFGLRFTPLQFALDDGTYQGLSALVRVAGGLVADRGRRHKEVAAAGYGLSAAAKLGLWVAGTAWIPLVVALAIDRAGKGIRTAPRDALITLSAPKGRLGEAFGVHRALDTAGAMIGPMLGFALLALNPHAFDAVFATSFCIALIGLGIVTLLVTNPPDEPRPAADTASVTLRSTLALLRRPAFGRIVVASTVLSLVTASDGLVYLTLQRRAGIDPTLLPLMFVGTAAVYLVAAIPFGRLADSIGRGTIFLFGHVLLAGVYGVLLVAPQEWLALGACLLLFGGYYAATDGVMMGLASAFLPRALVTSGLALLTTATAVGRFLASVMYGALWVWTGVASTPLVFLIGLVVAIGAARLLLPRTAAEGVS